MESEAEAGADGELVGIINVISQETRIIIILEQREYVFPNIMKGSVVV